MKTSNRKLLYFNPGHETAIQSGMIHYTPRASVRKMMADLALLPLWYGKNNDYILIDESIDSSIFLNTIPEELRPSPQLITSTELKTQLFQEKIEAMPWGLSPQTIHLFKTLQAECEQLIIPQWRDEYTTLTGRETATRYLKQIQQILPEFQKIRPPQFCTNPDEISRFMTTCPPPYILKMPYSSSGRGLHRINASHLDKLSTQWITGAIKKQGMISIEPALDKVFDFALEFESDGKGTVRYQGLSVFNTLANGAFNGNMLDTQQSLNKQLTHYIPEELFKTIKETIIHLLSESLGSVYKGYFGVDMLIYRDKHSFAIHPFIELNLRYTMGLVAFHLSERLVHPSVNGNFIISHNKHAYIPHLDMQKTSPLQLKEGKILSGYLPLCPVSPTTNYQAYIVVQ